ncbi:MAG: hypothetical protein ACKVVP_23990, partial [Chloroflexota bacterium]
GSLRYQEPSVRGQVSTERTNRIDPRFRYALIKLQETIANLYPNATFQVSDGVDSDGVYLPPTIDMKDTEEVFNLIGERLLTIQIDEGLPVCVFQVRPWERVIAEACARLEVRSHEHRLTRLGTTSDSSWGKDRRRAHVLGR